MRKILGFLLIVIVTLTPLVVQGYSLEHLDVEYNISFGFESYTVDYDFSYLTIGSNEWNATCLTEGATYEFIVEQKVLLGHIYIDYELCPCLNDVRCPRFSINSSDKKYRFVRMAQNTNGETIYLDQAIYLSEQDD